MAKKEPETTAEKLNALIDTEFDGFTEWELDFIENMSNQLVLAEEDKIDIDDVITERQKDAIHELYHTREEEL